MKIGNLTFVLLLGIVLSGLIAAGYVSVHGESATSSLESQNQTQAASISKGTILFLLAVGIIGVLGVSRKKKGIAGPAQKNEVNGSTENQNLNARRQEAVGKKS